MGTSFVTLSREPSEDERGFWISDSMLELWLRLLALHLPEPTDVGETARTPTAQGAAAIRDQWLLASRGYFNGCVPHGMGDACLTEDGRAVVRAAIEGLLTSLQQSEAPLDAATLNLFGMQGSFERPIERKWLREVGYAFVDLLDGKITGLASSAEVMPGSVPYERGMVR
jgi:hypothetical protein